MLPADETHYAYLVEGGKAVKYRVRVGRTEGGERAGARPPPGDRDDRHWVPFTG